MSPVPIQIKMPPMHQGREDRKKYDDLFAPGIAYDYGGQRVVINRGARHNVLFAGRRWGKSLMALAWGLKGAFQGDHVWWIWPTRPEARNGWEYLKTAVSNIPDADVREVPRRVDIGSGYIQIKSAHNPDSLRGWDINKAIFDEASYMRHGQYLYEEVIRPPIAESAGSLMFITSPAGFDWVYALWEQAKDLDDWAAWRFPSWDNPGMPIAEVKKMQQEMSEEAFMIEIAAASIARIDGVFAKLDKAATAEEINPALVTSTSAGLDIARLNDYQSLSISDDTFDPPQQIYLERWRHKDWEMMIDLAIEAMVEYKVDHVLVDGTGAGDIYVEDLMDKVEELDLDIDVEPYIFTARSKETLIKEYAKALRTGEYKILPDSRSIEEHNKFVGKLNKQTLHVKYEAETGHDDMVISSALNWIAVRQRLPYLEVVG